MKPAGGLSGVRFHCIPMLLPVNFVFHFIHSRSSAIFKGRAEPPAEPAPSGMNCFCHFIGRSKRNRFAVRRAAQVGQIYFVPFVAMHGDDMAGV